MTDKTKYDNIEIPCDLYETVQCAIDEGLAKRKRARVLSVLKKAGCAAAAFFICVVAALNLSSGFAEAACDIPIVGNICSIFLFREYHVSDELKHIDAQIPQIEDTRHDELEARVNQEIHKIVNDLIKESEDRSAEYYKAFVETGGDPDEFIPVGITIDYETKYISKQYVSFIIYQYETRFSAYNTKLYYNIDMENGRQVTLADLFGTNYRRIVADSIESSIAGWSDEERSILWDDLSIIDLISENTNFYFNNDGQVVVVIEKYAAAYGAAGELEFVIQTDNE